MSWDLATSEGLRSGRGSHAVHATLDARSKDPGRLLRLLATFHQRGIEIIALEVDPPRAGRQSVRAVFEASPGQATTLHRSVTRRVDVLTAELALPPSCPREALP